MEIKREGKKRIIDIPQEEKLKKEQKENLEAAIKELQDFLVKQYKTFKPKFPL